MEHYFLGTMLIWVQDDTYARNAGSRTLFLTL